MDPRITREVRTLPGFQRACERFGNDAETTEALGFLGVKLSDARFYLNRLENCDWGLPGDIARARRLSSASRALDAYVFAAYGALDTLTLWRAALA
ncbi:MAG: hypothetical protein ACREOR_06595 [Candidatus Binatia bacterium]